MEHNRNNNNRWDEWDNKSYRPQQENRNQYKNRPQDPDTYRGAYRQDISSDHRHVSTYNGFEGIRNQPEHRHPDRETNRYQHQNDFDRQHQSDWHSGSNPRSATNYRQEWEERARHAEHRRRDGRFTNDWEDNNFNEEYAPDNYLQRRGENAGNMAGSLSFGYDGDRNSNPDAHRRYDPLSGEIRQRQEPNRNQNQNTDFSAGQQNARERWGHY